MGILPKIAFVDSDDPIKEKLKIGWVKMNKDWFVRRDGTYVVISDEIFIFNELSSTEKLKTLLHELGHALSFRIPFYIVRETLNWFFDTKYNNSILYTKLSEYLDIYRPWRNNYGRFPWLFGIRVYPEVDEK